MEVRVSPEGWGRTTVPECGYGVKDRRRQTLGEVGHLSLSYPLDILPSPLEGDRARTRSGVGTVCP